MSKTLEQIQKELDDAKQKLASYGKSVALNSETDFEEDGMIKSDFELPYSSMPRLRTKKWLKKEFAANIDL